MPAPTIFRTSRTGPLRDAGRQGEKLEGRHRAKLFTVYEPPAFRSPEEVHSALYQDAPYVRVMLPDRGRVDAMAARWSSTHVLIAWEEAPSTERLQAWVPAGWVTRIQAEESAWRAPYGRTHG